jgi:hypothetical protein
MIQEVESVEFGKISSQDVLKLEDYEEEVEKEGHSIPLEESKKN